MSPYFGELNALWYLAKLRTRMFPQSDSMTSCSYNYRYGTARPECATAPKTRCFSLGGRMLDPDRKQSRLCPQGSKTQTNPMSVPKAGQSPATFVEGKSPAKRPIRLWCDQTFFAESTKHFLPTLKNSCPASTRPHHQVVPHLLEPD